MKASDYQICLSDGVIRSKTESSCYVCGSSNRTLPLVKHPLPYGRGFLVQRQDTF